MSPRPVCVRSDASVAECAAHLLDNRIRHLPVVNEEGSLIGLVSDFAVFQRGGLAAPDGTWFSNDGSEDATAGQLVSDDVCVVFPAQQLSAVLRQMVHAGQDVAVVVDGDSRPLGIITEHDLVRVAARELSPRVPACSQDTCSVVAVQAGAPYEQVRMLMLEAGLRHLVVLEHGVLHGVISWRNLANPTKLRHTSTARDLARTQPVYSVTEQTTMLEAAMLMTRWKVGCLPILDDDQRVIGLVTRPDVMRALIDTL